MTKDSTSKSAPVNQRSDVFWLTMSKGTNLLGSESWIKPCRLTLPVPDSRPAKLGSAWCKRSKKSALLVLAPYPLSDRNQKLLPPSPGANWTPLKPWTGWLVKGVSRLLVGLVKAAPEGGPSAKVSAGREANPINLGIVLIHWSFDQLNE